MSEHGNTTNAPAITVTLSESQWGKIINASKLHQDECIDGELWTSAELKDAAVALHRALYSARQKHRTTK